jgi:hypothetical protein
LRTRRSLLSQPASEGSLDCEWLRWFAQHEPSTLGNWVTGNGGTLGTSTMPQLCSGRAMALWQCGSWPARGTSGLGVWDGEKTRKTRKRTRAPADWDRVREQELVRAWSMEAWAWSHRFPHSVRRTVATS